MPSHVFVVPGDLTRLAVDAWLLPTDSRIEITDHWLNVPGVREARDRLRESPAGAPLRNGDVRAMAVPDWTGNGPQPVLVTVPLSGVSDAAEIEGPLREGLRIAADRTRGRSERGTPLIGMPLFAAGGGGGDRLRGRLLEVALTVAEEMGRAKQVDVALVLKGGGSGSAASNASRDLAQAQAIRRARQDGWQDLGPELQAKALDLAAEARNGRLVPFFGAGMSRAAGLPMWATLIKQLAEGAGLDDRESEALKRLPILDQADVLRSSYADRPAFARAVAKRTTAARYGLGTALLGGLPTSEAVTLNYDDLYEKACEDTGRPVAILPHETVPEGGRWLLKLHGTVTAPETIVLTREDYLGYSSGRAALSALAKALLLTRHLLFVGFGLEDDHFHELVHDVRQVLPAGPRKERLGTALLIDTNPLFDKLWGNDLRLVPMGGEVKGQGRTLEIFLDCLLAHADQGVPFFLDERFAHRLTAPEVTLRERLRALAAETGDDQRATAAWSVVADALDRLGAPEQLSRRVQPGDE
ncbi:MAG: hypothetical protein EKK42_06595 [Pseudonocardiaceae bacterium]|nr:MAG: hypothetical protein EKK42_06595 [Pseudonocardiaceae bacterium]